VGFASYTMQADASGNLTATSFTNNNQTGAIDENGNGYFAGNVGIGTQTPQAALDVEGDARFSGVVHVEPQGDLDMGAFTTDPSASGNQQDAMHVGQSGASGAAGAMGNSAMQANAVTIHSGTLSAPARPVTTGTAAGK